MVLFSDKLRNIVSVVIACMIILLSVISCGSDEMLNAFKNKAEDDVFDGLYYMKINRISYYCDSVIMYRTENALIYYYAYHGISKYSVTDSSGTVDNTFNTHAISYISIKNDVYSYQGEVVYANKNGANKYSPDTLSYIVDEYKAAVESCLETKVYTEDEITAALAEAEARANAENSSAVASSAQ